MGARCFPLWTGTPTRREGQTAQLRAPQNKPWVLAGMAVPGTPWTTFLKAQGQAIKQSELCPGDSSLTAAPSGAVRLCGTFGGRGSHCLMTL